MRSSPSDPERMVASYLTLRRTIGTLGVSLPFVLLFSDRCKDIEDSISAYYATRDMGDVFVGILVAIGVCLWAYKGYDPVDDLLGDIGGAAAIGIALFPVTSTGATRFLHYAFAIVMFGVLAVFCLWLFRKTHEKCQPTDEKKRRNLIYACCGWTIVACIALIAARASLQALTGWCLLETLHPVFWLETIALVVFAVSWFVKGEVLLKDRPEPDGSTHEHSPLSADVRE